MQVGVYGKEQSYIGDDVWCPACQSMGKITPDQDRLSTKVNGRMPALNDDLCLCKCSPPPKLVHSQTGFREIVSETSQESSIKASDVKKNNLEEKRKEITSIYWSYGDECMPLQDKSRFYTDINLHVGAIGYNAGDEIDINVNFLHENLCHLDFNVKIKLDESGYGVAMSILKNTQLIINGD